MSNYLNIIKYTGLAIAVIAGVGMGAAHAQAEADFMTSWQTKTYVPAWYEGKAFPTYQSFITVSFELIDNGKVVDLSKTAVRWYANGKLLKNEASGLGIKQITVFNKNYGGDVTSIKIAIPDYKGQALNKLFDIPVKKPEVVIDAPYFQKKMTKGQNSLYAWPFFFNTTNANTLNLQWTVDDNAQPSVPATDPQLIFTVRDGARPGGRSVIEATMINKGKTLENVMKKIFVDMP